MGAVHNCFVDRIRYWNIIYLELLSENWLTRWLAIWKVPEGGWLWHKSGQLETFQGLRCWNAITHMPRVSATYNLQNWFYLSHQNTCSIQNLQLEPPNGQSTLVTLKSESEADLNVPPWNSCGFSLPVRAFSANDFTCTNVSIECNLSRSKSIPLQIAV